jgi:hypothetical protein
LPQLLEQITVAEMDSVPPILVSMTKDVESNIRMALCEQFIEIAKIFQQVSIFLLAADSARSVAKKAQIL